MSTIDPGIEDGIQQSADDVSPDKPERDHVQEEEEALNQPSRWWFASTACPLIAGTFGPMASGFNICSIAFEWREYIPPGGTEAIGMQTGNTLKDPPWTIAVNAISLFFAIIGNATLLLNMAHRLRFSIAQPITITGFLLAGVLLIVDIAALAGNPHYYITRPEAVPDAAHALTHAFYFAVFAGVIYIIIALLMSLTVYGANKGHYDKNFNLTAPQRTLMLQTMAFISYLLLGALVYSEIEGWAFVNAVYWADVTLLTVGLGDYAPSTTLGRALMFPFAIGGILMVGLVVGSIRSLVLDRGKQKIAARIVEKRRSRAIHNVDARKQTIRISRFAKADFSVDPGLSPTQRREEEFNVMRKVQGVAERERRYFALATSSTFALMLWFVGAAIFQKAENHQGWSYFEALYFSYVSLLTIGYGDYTPQSNAGKAFYVLWSLLAVPSLTILISNMGDTIVKWFSDFTVALGSVTVLPGEKGMRATAHYGLRKFLKLCRDGFRGITLPGVMGAAPQDDEKPVSISQYQDRLLDQLAGRLFKHLGEDQKLQPPPVEIDLEADIQFYHYVLARECRDLQKDLHSSPPKQYKWDEWEYFLKLIGNEGDPEDNSEDFPGQLNPNVLVPEAVRAPSKVDASGRAGTDGANDGSSEDAPSDEARKSSTTALLASGNTLSNDRPTDPPPNDLDGNIDRQTSVAQKRERHKFHGRRRRPGDSEDLSEPDYLRNWSWLSNRSPLMSQKAEAEWILERLSAALERELNRQRRGWKRRPPVSLRDAYLGRGEGKQGGKERKDLRRAAGGVE